MCCASVYQSVECPTGKELNNKKVGTAGRNAREFSNHVVFSK